MALVDALRNDQYSVAPPRPLGVRPNPLRRRGLPRVLDARLAAMRQRGGYGTQALQGGGAGVHGMDYGQGPNDEGMDPYQPQPMPQQPGAEVDPGFEMRDEQMGPEQDLRARLMKRFATAVPQEPALTSRVALNRFLQQRRRPQGRKPMLPARKPIGGAY